ncbi:MAG: CRISPR-associated protein Cas4 [Thermoplasmataceae archaeon]
MEAILILIFAVFVILVLIVAASGKRKSFGVPRGKKIYGDMLTKGKVLRSERYFITGKPDLITRKGKLIVPYEYKSGNASEPRTGHLLQMGAYFIILGDMYPESIIKYGILKYGNSTFRVENTHGLRNRVLAITGEIRANSGIPARNHNNRGRCFRCPYKDLCSQNLIQHHTSEDA